MNANSNVAPLSSDHRHARIAPNLPDPLKKLEPLAVTMSCHRGEEICGQDQPADFWYRLMAGAARRCALRLDGRRQIVDLLLPGDFFGLTARDEYDFTIEAVTDDTMVTGYPRRRVEMLADSDPLLAREIRALAFESISRLQAQLLVIGRVTATEKVGSFLLQLAARTSDGSVVVLPLSRYDIADYLALSVETVSRSLSDLKHRGVIALSGTRRVRIVDRDALED
jgi:CRP/FNR family nitrogen fixation transcriptional regulator